jgi:hypothetical protein
MKLKAHYNKSFNQKKAEEKHLSNNCNTVNTMESHFSPEKDSRINIK